MKPFKSENDESPGSHSTSAMPERVENRLATGAVVELDVRPILEAGREPFQAIMQAVDRLGDQQVFKLRAPFEPTPLYAVLGGKGFGHWSRTTEEGVWEIFFYREEEEEVVEGESIEENDFSIDDTDDTVVELDVRGLEPPEPLERVLEAAEQLAYGDILKVRHHREPLILFDVLGGRDFVYRSEQLAADEWEIRIWRKN